MTDQTDRALSPATAIQVELTRSMARDILTMTDDQIAEQISAQTTSPRLQRLSEAMETLTGEMINLYMLLTWVASAAQHGSGQVLIEGLRDYPDKLTRALTAAVLANDQLKAFTGGRDIIVHRDVENEAELARIVGKYIEGIRRLIAPGGDNGAYLREVSAKVNEDVARLRQRQPKVGRPGGLEPLQRQLAERADKGWNEDRNLDWQRIAERVYADLIGTRKRSKDEDSMLAWFDQVAANSKSGRKAWKKRLHEIWRKWNQENKRQNNTF